jgi:hypothetical protein
MLEEENKIEDQSAPEEAEMNVDTDGTESPDEIVPETQTEEESVQE